MNVWKSLRTVLGGPTQRVCYAQILFFLVLCGLFASLWSTLKPQILDQEVYKLDAKKIRVWNPPAWIPENFVDETLELIPPEARKEKYSTLDPTLVAKLKRAFSDSPWVEKVVSIELSFPARADVTLEFRVPTAFVDSSTETLDEFLQNLETLFVDDDFLKLLRKYVDADARDGEKRGGETRLVDSSGRRLDDKYYRDKPEERAKLPTIMTYGPSDEFLSNAASLVDYLNESGIGALYGLDKLHVLKAVGETEPTYFITTRTGQTVKWGTFSGPKTVAVLQYDGQRVRPNDAQIKRERNEYQKNKLTLWKSRGDGEALDLSNAADDGSENE